MSILEVHNVTSGYGDHTILNQINFKVEKGEIFGIIGPNGSGKSTLLKCISQWLPLSAGSIKLNNVTLSEIGSKDRAKKIAVLPQDVDYQFSYKVETIVMMGRYPHVSGLFKTTSTKDIAIVEQAMIDTSVNNLKHHYFETLSGGEKQRVLLARALAQEPELLLLDEPTNHLDIHHQVSLLNLLGQVVREKQLTVVTILHDLNLASLYCDRLMLLKSGRVHSIDTPSQNLKERTLNEIYDQSVIVKEHPFYPSPAILISKYKANHPSLKYQVGKTAEESSIQFNQPIKCFSSIHRDKVFHWTDTICWGESSCENTGHISEKNGQVNVIELGPDIEKLGYLIVIKNDNSKIQSLLVICNGLLQERDMLTLYQYVIMNYYSSIIKSSLISDNVNILIASTQSITPSLSLNQIKTYLAERISAVLEDTMQ